MPVATASTAPEYHRRAEARPASPPGVQFANATVPPGRHTRSSSRAVTAWSGANMAPTALSTTSSEGWRRIANPSRQPPVEPGPEGADDPHDHGDVEEDVRD